MTALGAILSTADMRNAIPVIQYEAPTTGQTITVGSSGHVKLCINPAGTLLALTCNLPSTPTDGDELVIVSSQIVTTFTMANGTILGPLTSLAVATFARFTYFSTPAKWFRSG